MAQGRNNAGIAQALFLSERAVEKHINSLFSKLGLSEEPDVHRRVKAVLLYLVRAGGVSDLPDDGGLPPWAGARDGVRPWIRWTAPEGATKTVSVLIVDDQLPFRAVARTVIGMTAGFEVAAEAESRRGRGRRGRRRPARSRADGHQPARASTASKRRAGSRAAHPDVVGDPAVDVLRGRPARRRARLRRDRVRAQGGLRSRARCVSSGTGDRRTGREPSSGISPLIVVPVPGRARRRAATPPIAPSRSAMFTKPWP